MNFQLTVDDTELAQMGTEILAKITGAQTDIEHEMALDYLDCVKRNIGDSGPYRPMSWPALSPKYAARVGRAHATLLVDGDLLSAIQVDGNTVSTSNDRVPYALVHQFGGGNNIPARPYFPMLENRDPTPVMQARMEDVASQAIERLLK